MSWKAPKFEQQEAEVGLLEPGVETGLLSSLQLKPVSLGSLQLKAGLRERLGVEAGLPEPHGAERPG